MNNRIALLLLSGLLLCRISATLSGQSSFTKDSLLALEYFTIADTSYMDVDKCLRYTNMAIPLLQKTGQWAAYVYCLNSRSYCYTKKEYYDSLEINNVFALAEAKRYLDPGHQNYITALNNLGFLYGEVKQDYQRALDLYLSAIERDSIKVTTKGTLLKNIGSIYRKRGDFEKSILYYNEAIPLFERAHREYVHLNNKNYFKIAEVYQELAKLYSYQKKYTESIAYLKKELSLMQGNNQSFDHSYYVYNYTNQARIFLKLQQWRPAEQLLQQALLLPGLTSFQKAEIQMVYAERWMAGKDFSRALTTVDQALSLLPQDQPIGRSQGLKLKGDILLKLGRFEDAFFYYNRAAALLQPTLESGYPDPSAYTLSRLDLINVVLARGRALLDYHSVQPDELLLEEALRYYRMASELSDLIRLDYHSEETKLFLNENAHDFYADAIGIAYRLYERTQQEKYLESAFFFFEKSKATALLDELKAKEVKGAFAIPESTVMALDEIRTELNFIDQLLLIDQKKAVTDPAKQRSRNSRKLRLTQQRDSIYDHIAGTFPQYLNALRSEVIDISMLEQQIISDERSAFIEYFLGAQEAFAILISKNARRFVRIPRPDKISNLLAVFQDKLKLYGKDGMRDFSLAAHALYQHLISPLEIPDGIKKLSIVPDGFLATLPFEALLFEKVDAGQYANQLPYLLQKYMVQYGASGTILSFQDVPPSGPLEVLVVAPVFADIPSKKLDHSLTEIETFNKFQAKLLLGKDANIKDFKAGFDGYGIIHLATHSTAYDSLLEQPAIDFFDGQLYLNDLYTLNAKAHLAVLSSCETATGRINPGEGVSSLARGFAYAGIPSLITSLWKVSDRATSDIMHHFYNFLDQGLTKDEALRKAKLHYLNTCNETKASPYYWAGFIQIGNAQSIRIRSETTWSTYWRGIILLLIPLGWLFYRKLKL